MGPSVWTLAAYFLLGCIGLFLLGGIFQLLALPYTRKKQREEEARKAAIVEKSRQEELAREAIPCVACALTPNSLNHSCSLDVQVNQVEVANRILFSEFLQDTRGRISSPCKVSHTTELQAKAHGAQLKRNLQTGTSKTFLSDVSPQVKSEIQTKRGKTLGLNEATWATIVLNQNFKCFYCGLLGDVKTFHREHKTPLARGGADHINNIVAACAPCNLDKKIMTSEEYMKWRLDRAEYTQLENNLPGNPLRPKTVKLPKSNLDIKPPEDYELRSTLSLDDVRVLIAIYRSQSKFIESENGLVRASILYRRDLDKGVIGIYELAHWPKHRVKNPRTIAERKNRMLKSPWTLVETLNDFEMELLIHAFHAKMSSWIPNLNGEMTGLMRLQRADHERGIKFSIKLYRKKR